MFFTAFIFKKKGVRTVACQLIFLVHSANINLNSTTKIVITTKILVVYTMKISFV